MLTTEQINDLHRLYWSEHWPIRKIERHLNMGWKTIKKYLDAPAQGPVQARPASKLDPFKGTIAEWLEKDPHASAAVIEQRLRPLGYHGGHSILRQYVHKVRPQLAQAKRAFVRMEPLAGERFEVDWGHFGALDYSGDQRKLYAFALVDAHSRMLYVEFTHSQSFETFVRCHIHAFQMPLGGVAARSPMTIWPPPSPNMTAGWSAFFRASSPSPVNTTSIRGPAIRRAAGKKEKWNAPSAIFARTSGRCASSPICTM
jgi:transposase